MTVSARLRTFITALTLALPGHTILASTDPGFAGEQAENSLRALFHAVGDGAGSSAYELAEDLTAQFFSYLATS